MDDVLETWVRGWGTVPDSELSRAGEVFHQARVPARTLLVREGDPTDTVWFVAEGLVRTFHVDAGGRERTRGFRQEGHLVCPYAAYLRGEKSDVFIETLEPSTLLVARRDAFDRLTSGHPSWREVVARITERLYLGEEGRHRDLLVDDAATRYRGFLAAQPDVARRVSLALVASYLGIAPESLSRIRAQILT